MRFRPKVASVGDNVRIWLVPHLGEFDQAVLFMKTLDYESPVFKWLAANAPTKYGLVIEIGANVGVYTVFLDTLARWPGSKLGKIIAFEPAPEAFRRLLNNLAANSTRHVQALHAAVAPASGLKTFFEPAGHLTNGSFVREFAALFSDSITETEVVAVATTELEKFLCEAQKVLIKIDVEGFEPALIAGLAPLIQKYRPDLLIEVLDETAEKLEQMSVLQAYRKFLITSTGLEEFESLFASASCRDWVLLFDPQSHAAPVQASVGSLN